MKKKLKPLGIFVGLVVLSGFIGCPDPSSPEEIQENRAPGAPTISGSIAGDTQVVVTWTAPSDKGIINGDGSEGTITKYTVYWGDSTGFTCSDSKKAEVTDATTHTITGLTNGTEVFFIVTATNATGEGAASTEDSGTPVEANKPPGAPAISGSTAGDGQVVVTWTAPSDMGIINGDGSEGTITKYTVYWGASTGFTPSDDKKADVTDTTNTTYTIIGLTNGEEVFFIVTATNAAGEGAASTEDSGTPVEANKPPGAPASIDSTAGDGQVVVNWTAPSDTGIINGDGTPGTITKYTVYWGDSTGFTRSDDKKADVTDTTNTTYTITGLTNGEEVFFIVTASNTTGESAASTEGSATPPVAVTSVAIADKATTDVAMGGTLQLSATVEPNNATNKQLTWSSGDSNVATVDPSGLVTSVAVGGPITITVTSDADSSMSDSIEITVKEGINSIDYGAIIGTKDVATSVTPTIDPQGATGTFSVTSGTLPSGLNLDSGSGEISGTPDQLTTEAVSVTIAMTGTGDYTGTVTKVVTIEVLEYGIGSTGPAGGIVFYVKDSESDGWRYLEAAPSDLSVTAYKWGDTTTRVTTGADIGTGKSNTAAIVAAMEDAGFTENYAAKACADYTEGGYGDWFLPSRDELAELYKLKDTVGSFASDPNDHYWSSSDYSAVIPLAYFHGFDDNASSASNRGNGFSVRAVRAF